MGGVRNWNPFALDHVDDVFFVADAGLDGIWRVDGASGRAKLVAFSRRYRIPCLSVRR